MKNLLIALLIAFSATGVRAASTGTRTTEQINAELKTADENLNEQLAAFEAMFRQDEIGLDGMTYVFPLKVPVEQKVVEIHMTTTESAPAKEAKNRRKTKKLPFDEYATCSGSFVNGNGDILTARHCVDGFNSFEVQTADRRTYTAVVVATSAAHDLALIHIDRSRTPYFELADNATRGETVFVLGSPLGITDTLSTGVIARLDGDLTLIDCGALPGNSGGPVFDQEQNLIGVLNAGLIVMYGVTHLNVVQGRDAVYFFLREVQEKLHGLK